MKKRSWLLFVLILCTAFLVLPLAVSAQEIGSNKLRESDGMNMVYVPAGKFVMGVNNGATNEKPEHIVNLDAFWIDQTEVTNRQYELCTNAGECTRPGYMKSDTQSSYFGNPEFADYPVVYVNWNQAQAYCTWAGAKLPTEAQWEKAARGTDGRLYPWGEVTDGDKLNFCDANCAYAWADKGRDDGYTDTAPVGSYPLGASPYGTYDMAGNVTEWVNDWYASDYYSNDAGQAQNPTGPLNGDSRIYRDGSWYNTAGNSRATYRGTYSPSTQYNTHGFRCATQEL